MQAPEWEQTAGTRVDAGTRELTKNAQGDGGAGLRVSSGSGKWWSDLGFVLKVGLKDPQML